MALMVVAPAAIAWACNPQANVSLDRTTYSPGQTITVYGSYFPSNASITVTGPNGSVGIQTSSSGAFSTTFEAPSRAGSYVISATRPTGGAASAGYRVAAPAANRPSAPTQTEAPGGAAPRMPSFDSPSIVRSERQRSTTGSGGNDRGGPGAQPSPGNSGSGSGGGVVSSPSGSPVFVGSAPPAAASTGTFATVPGAPAAAVGSAGKAARKSSASPSEQAAAGYVWSGFAPGRTPSLSTAGDMVSEGDSGPGLGLGIGLLAVGLLALVAGLTAAEVSRRRAAA